MIEVTRRYRFAASHRLHSPLLSEADNDRIYGKCNNPFGHGHDYVLDVTAAAPVDPATGVAVPRAVLDALVESAILAHVRDRDLNRLPWFRHLVPTTENLAAAVQAHLGSAWERHFASGGPQLRRVRIEETARNTVQTDCGRNEES